MVLWLTTDPHTNQSFRLHFFIFLLLLGFRNAQGLRKALLLFFSSSVQNILHYESVEWISFFIFYSFFVYWILYFFGVCFVYLPLFYVFKSFNVTKFFVCYLQGTTNTYLTLRFEVFFGFRKCVVF